MVRNGAFRWAQLVSDSEEEDIAELAKYLPPTGRDKPWAAEELWGQARSIHWFSYDPVRVVNADP